MESARSDGRSVYEQALDGGLLDSHWGALLLATTGEAEQDRELQESLTEMAEEAIREGHDEAPEVSDEWRGEEQSENDERSGPQVAHLGEEEDGEEEEEREARELYADDSVASADKVEASDDDEEAEEEEGEDEQVEELSTAVPGKRRLSMEDVLQLKKEEEARVMLELEADGDHPNVNHEAREGDGLKQTEAEDSDTEEAAAFGLPRVELHDPSQPARRTSLTSTMRMAVAVAADIGILRRLSTRAVRPMGSPQALALEAARTQFLHSASRVLWELLTLLDALYVFLSVPLRIGYLYDPWDNQYKASGGLWTPQLTMLTVLDVLGEIVRWRYTYKLVRRLVKRRTRVRSASSAWMPRKLTATGSAMLAKSGLLGRQMRNSLFSVRSDKALDIKSFDAMRSFEALKGVTDNGSPLHIVPPPSVLLLGIVPFELLAAFTNRNLLHVARSGKVLLTGYSLVASYSSLLIKARGFTWAQWLSFSTLATPFYLFWIGLYMCHVAACGYMFLANYECGLRSEHCVKTPIPGSWVLKDNMEQATLWRQYVRSMYWASKTITTLGQGDLVPATQMETNYCIIVQYISGLWATAFLASCSFYFSRRDADIENGVSTRLEQALRFLRSRNVPSTLAIQIRNYYQHIQRTRNGIEEDQVLDNLPSHYRFQCAFFVKYRLIAKVPFLSKQSKAFLRTVVDELDSDFHSPKDIILALFDIEELVIVARGEVCVLNQQKELVHVLSAEEWFAEDALFDDHRSPFELEAKSFCEIYRLSRAQFMACMEKHFPKLRIAIVVAQQRRRPAVQQGRAAQASRPTPVMMRPHSTRTSLFKLLTATNSLEALPWQHPNSLFRKRWQRWKAVFLLILAIEVPFEIAFKWRRGFFDPEVFTSDRIVYSLAIVTEIFFYVDWYFRAYKFTRRDGNQKDGQAGAGREDTQKSLRADMAATVVRKRDDLVTKPKDIFRLYLASDDVIYDALAMVPISVVWNFANQTSYNIILRELMRFARLLALGRVLALKPIMKRIMVEFDFSPAGHLLANVIVFCIISANAMACYFYLIADDKDFVDALPVGFDSSLTPVSGAQCLEQATLFGNCTWFIYDRSAYGIEARYIRSMHWSLVLLSTVGYGDVLSFSNSECLIGFWWIYLGALICYFTSCAVGSVISQVTVLRSAHDERVEEITRALVRSNVSLETRVKVRCHYEANWELNGSVGSEETLMKRLPRSLRHQLSSSLYLPVLRKCYIFAGFGGQLSMIREIALAMTSFIVLPRFPIVESGHLSAQMYLIQSGEAEILLPMRFRGGSVVSVKKDGLWHQQRKSSAVYKLWLGIRSMLKRTRSQESSFSDDHIGSASTVSAFLSRGDRYRLKDVPIAVVREGDCFGEEGLLPQERFALGVSVRALTSTQVAVLHRNAFLSLSDRFPLQVGQMIALIAKRHEDNRRLVATVRGNLDHKDKVREYLGSSSSVYAEIKSIVNGIITPDRDLYRIWHAIHGLILFYNFYQITFRLAFIPSPSPSTMLKLCVVDYLIDMFLYADIYLKWNRFGYEQYGGNVTNLYLIRRRYKSRWFKIDCISMIPLYYYGDYFFMTLARVPRLLKTPQLLEVVDGIESVIREKFMKGSTTLLSLFDLLKFFVYFLSAAHHIGSCYYLLGRVLTTYGFADASWMTADFVINTYPGDILVQYNRAVYWCLETFTVVCFGDVISRSPLETVYASMICIIGWMCIGQVVGRITSLMASIDKDSKEHNNRVDNFEQYARNRRLPTFLRERAIESVEYKSKCLIELNMVSIFEDLPQALHVILFEELYGRFIRGVPDFVEVFTACQLRALANAFLMQIFVSDDIIIEEGRLGTELYVMKEGRAEYFSAHSRIVFAAVHEGVLFGDLAFFLSGTRQIASVRASRSCQVLHLDRTKWQTLWSDEMRAHLEAKIVPIMRNKYRSVTRAFLNIVKNLELSMRTATKQSPPGLQDLAPDMGASTRSIQSSIASGASSHVSGASSHSKASELSNSQAANSPQATQITSNEPRWFGRGRDKITPISPKRFSRQKSKKRKTSNSGSNRKLNAVLGIPATRRHPSKEDLSPEQSSELQWERHERNLRLLQFIDNRMLQDDQALGIRRAPRSGNMDRNDNGAEAGDTNAAPSAAEMAPKNAMAPIASAMGSRKPVPRSDRDLLSRQGTTTSPTRIGKRHSIQMDRKDMNEAFRAVDDRKKPKERYTGVQRPVRADETAANAPARSMAPINRANSPPSVANNTPSSVHARETEANTHETATNGGDASAGSVGSSGGSEGNEPSAYVQHLQNLKFRSQRRQRRSVLTVVGKSHVEEEVDETKNPYEIWLEPPLPPAFCLENSKFRRLWSSIMYAICMYYILIVPFRVSFDFDYLTSPETSTMTTMWFVCEYALDALCVVDFFLQKNYFTFVHRGTLVTDKQAIRDHYLRDGTYLVDLFCITPLELLIPLVPFLQAVPVGSVPGAHSKVTWYRIAVFRLNKMVRIAHLNSLGDKVQRMLVYDLSLSSVRPSMVYFVRFVFDFGLGAHWVACLFFGVAFNAFQEGTPSWLTTPGMLTFEGIRTEREISDVHWLMKYSRSYHFSMGAITTVSYGDIAPQNAWETFVGTFVIVISIVLFGMLSGGFSQVFEMELGKRADYEEKIASVAHFMMFHRFPTRIWKHMQSYFMVHWKESQGMHEEELLSGLPLSVKRDVALFVKQDFVKQMRLFSHCEEAFVRAVVAAFDQELFVRNDVIITYGERGRRSLYVIESGHVLVRVPKKIDPSKTTSAAANAAVNAGIGANAAPLPSRPPSPLRPMSPRSAIVHNTDIEIIKSRYDFFGEKSLIFDVPRSATCIALSSCSMLILTLEKYEEILLEFPEYREKNMRDWIFANTRENTPAIAIRSPTRLLAKIRSKRPGAAALSPEPEDAGGPTAGPVAPSTVSAPPDSRTGPVMPPTMGPPPLPPPPAPPSAPPPLPPVS